MLRGLFGRSIQERRHVRRGTLAVTRLDDRINPSALINEVLINPPGSTDAPKEYIEVRVTPGTPISDLTNLHVVALEGEIPGSGSADPGTVDFVYKLTAQNITDFTTKFDTNSDGFTDSNGGLGGLIFLTGTSGTGYTPSSTNSLVVATTALNGSGAKLENGSSSFLTLTSSVTITKGSTDLDADDDGALDTITGVSYIDGVGYRDVVEGPDDFIYGVEIDQTTDATPDVLARDKDNTTAALSGSGAGLWYAGELIGSRDANGNWEIDSIFGTLPAGTKTTAGDANPV